MAGQALSDAVPTARATRRPRIGVVADFREEGWPSMDLTAEMLHRNLEGEFGADVDVSLIRPAMPRRFARSPVGPRRRWHNADRLLGRFWDYPRLLRGRAAGLDLYHVVDHSYAHLVEALPAGRAVVTCHDLDAFRCLFDAGTGSSVLRAMARRTLAGLQRAERVICVSGTTRDELVRQRLVEPARIRVIPNGVHPSCTPEPQPEGDAAADGLLGSRSGQNVEILHVGSTISRKRIDVLLRAFGGLHRRNPGARLVRVGGPFDASQARLVEELGIEGAVRVLPRLDRITLAAVYRRAALLLLPSEREGFGLPVIEALACGLPVLASDIPAVREVGVDAVEYARVGDVDDWIDRAAALLEERNGDPIAWANRCARGISRASRFTWRENARRAMAVYEEILD